MATIEDAVLQIAETDRYLNNIPSNAVFGMVQVVTDAARLAGTIAECLVNKENLNISTLIFLAGEDPSSWIGGGLNYMQPNERTLVYTALSQVLTERIEALHKKRHTYNALGMDDSNNLQKLESLLQKIAERNKVALPERKLEKNPTTRNYVPVDWSGFMQSIAKA